MRLPFWTDTTPEAAEVDIARTGFGRPTKLSTGPRCDSTGRTLSFDAAAGNCLVIWYNALEESQRAAVKVGDLSSTSPADLHRGRRQASDGAEGAAKQMGTHGRWKATKVSSVTVELGQVAETELGLVPASASVFGCRAKPNSSGRSTARLGEYVSPPPVFALLPFPLKKLERSSHRETTPIRVLCRDHKHPDVQLHCTIGTFDKLCNQTSRISRRGVTTHESRSLDTASTTVSVYSQRT